MDRKILIASELRRLVDNYRSSSFDPMVMSNSLDEFLKVPSEDQTSMLALVFWEAWADEAEHGFPGFYYGLVETDWPELAEELASNLLSNTPASNPKILDFRRSVESKQTWVRASAGIQKTLKGVGYVIAVACSLQIASAPVAIVAAYTPFIVPEWFLISVWVLIYATTAWLTIKLSRVRFGLILILIATVLSFALTEGSIAQLHRKYDKQATSAD